MGRYFSWEAIERDEVPEHVSFEVLKKTVVKELGNSRAMRAAQLCGSIPRGDWNIRSDCDVVVIYRDAQREHAVELLQELVAYAAALFIRLEFMPCDDVTAATTDHTFTASFLDHLSVSEQHAGGIIKKAPRSMIRAARESILEDTRQYLQHKTRTLQKIQIHYPTMSEEQQLRSLEKVLAFPVYAARKMLQTVGYDFSQNGDRRSEVLQAYRALPFLGNAYEPLRIINEVDSEYTFYVESGRMQKKDYDRITETVVGHIPLVLQFALANLTILRELEAHFKNA